MIKVAIEDLEKNIPFIVKHIEAGDHFLILKELFVHLPNVCNSTLRDNLYR